MAATPFRKKKITPSECAHCTHLRGVTGRRESAQFADELHRLEEQVYGGIGPYKY